MNTLWSIQFGLCMFTIVCMAKNISNHTKSTVKYLNDIRNEIEQANIIHPLHNIVLVLGTPNAKKSILVECVATDCSDIVSISSGFTFGDELETFKTLIHPRTVSQALRPKIFIDEAGIVWFDCPEPNISNQTDEIAETLLIKTILENASSVKVVLVVDSDSLFENNSHGFGNLLSRTTELIESTQRVGTSISLVITKVEPYKFYGGRKTRNSDENIKDSVIRFLRAYRQKLLKEDAKKIQLIDSLVNPAPKTECQIISIFWQPDQEGRMNEIPIIATARGAIRESILNCTSYAKMNINDFSFPLTAAAQLEISIMEKELADTISVSIRNILSRLKESFKEKFDQTKDVVEKLKLIEEGRDIIQTKRFHSNMTIQLRKNMKVTTDNSFDNEFDEIDANENDLNMLKSVADVLSIYPVDDVELIRNDLNYFFATLKQTVQESVGKRNQSCRNKLVEKRPDVDEIDDDDVEDAINNNRRTTRHRVRQGYFNSYTNKLMPR